MSRPMLEAPGTGSWIEVDAAAIRDNITGLCKEISPSRLCFVVKADAYGHGVETVIPEAEDVGLREFAVFSSHEAWHVLRHSDGGSAIQVMGHSAPDAIAWEAENGIEPWINDEADWQWCLDALRDLTDVPLRIHLEIETGMHRTGLTPHNAMRIAKAVRDLPNVEVRGVCTHLAGAEDPANHARIARQVAVFHETVEALPLPQRPLRHISSSSAALLMPECRLDMVRSGIACYGLWPTPEVRARYVPRDPDDPLTLRRALSWKTRVMATEHVAAGEYIGYGLAYRAPRDTTIATLPVGYGDGFSRSLSNAGRVLIGGQPCPIVGQVNMNMVQVDVGHLDNVSPGDVAVLIGEQGGHMIGIHSFSESQTIVNYELMARLSQDIPRQIIDPG